MTDPASAEDYVIGFDIYPPPFAPSTSAASVSGASYDEDVEDKAYDNHCEPELLLWEDPIQLPIPNPLEELDDEIFSTLPPGVLPVTDPQFIQNLPPIQRDAENSQRTLDDDDDSRYIFVNKKHAPVVKVDKLIREKWERSFGSVSDALDHSPPNPFLPFSSELEWKIADWFITEDPGHNSFNRFLEIPGVVEKLGLSYKNVREIHQLVDSLQASRDNWKSQTLGFEDNPQESFSIHYRDPVEVIRSLWSDPSLVDDLVFAPQKVYQSKTVKKRIYSEMWDGDWWNHLQASRLRIIISLPYFELVFPGHSWELRHDLPSHHCVR